MSGFRAFRIHNDHGRVFGQLETLTLNDLSPGEVIIRAACSSVNYKDALAATGAGKIVRRFPLVGGIDVAGYVESSKDRRFKEGDEVLVTGYDMGVSHDGGYADRVRVPAEWVIPLPKGMALHQAMALGTAGFTVGLCMQRLEDNRQTPDKGPMVVTGATGGVGSIAVDVLSGHGYSVTAITGKAHEHDYLRALGAEEILDRKDIELGSHPLESATWGGAIDSVGGDVLAWLTRTTKPWGSIVSVGLAGGSDLRTTVMPFILRGVSIIGVTSAGCPTELRNKIWLRLATDLAPRHLDAIAPETVALEQLPDVFNSLLKGAAKGRTVVTLGKA